MAEGISASSCRRTPTDRELEARAADEPRHQPAPRVDAASPGATVYAVQVPRGASKQDRAGAPRPMALEDLSKAMDARREVLERSSDPQARAAAARDLGKLQSTWADGARARGLKAPGDGFDPARASDKEIIGAYAWLKRGGEVPRGEVARDGGSAYARSLEANVALRAPWVKGVTPFDRFPAEVQRHALEGALARRSVKCEASETVPELRAKYERALDAERRASLAASVRRDEHDAKQKTIGLDGRVGTREAVEAYEVEEYVRALNPGTTAGTIAAAFGGDVEQKRKLGALGNLAEGALGAELGPKEGEPGFGAGPSPKPEVRFGR